MTDQLLVSGAVAGAAFVAVLLVEGPLRPGYDPIHHTGGELSLGDRGWIQIANFSQVGVGMLAYAVGVHRALDTVAGAVLLAVFGLALIAAGVFVVDPRRGYPPGAVSETRERCHGPFITSRTTRSRWRPTVQSRSSKRWGDRPMSRARRVAMIARKDRRSAAGPIPIGATA